MQIIIRLSLCVMEWLSETLTYAEEIKPAEIIECEYVLGNQIVSIHCIIFN